MPIGLIPKRSRRMSSIWTPERLATAKRLWLLGKSGGQIAIRLNCGVGREAVIAKMHREGLRRRA